MSSGRQETVLQAASGESPYDLLEEMGRSPYGITFKARDKGTQELVAVKEMAGTLPDGPPLEQLHTMCQTLIAFAHIAIADVKAVGLVGGKLFVVTEFLEGLSLRQQLDHYGPLDNDRALMIARQCSLALEYAHQRNLLHTSLKPANVFLMPGGTVKVTDYGMAYLAQLLGHHQPTFDVRSGAYRAPEADQRVWSRAGDLYSLGAVIYEAVGGQPPYVAPQRRDGAARFGYLELGSDAPQAREPELIDLRQLAPSVSDVLHAFCHATLEREPSRRPAHVNLAQQILAGKLADRAPRRPTATLPAAQPGGATLVPQVISFGTQGASATPVTTAAAAPAATSAPKCRLCLRCRRPISPTAWACLVCGQVQRPVETTPEMNQSGQRGDALFVEGRFAEAAQAYREAIAQEPGDAELYNKLGDSLAIQKAFAEARQAFERALQLDPHDADARQDLGLILLTMGETEAAWEQFHYVLQSAVDVELKLAARICLGAVCAHAGDLAGASRYWSQVLREENNVAPVHYSLGTVYAHLGHEQGARDEWEECLRLDPGHHEATVALGELQAAQARKETSQNWAGRSGATFLRGGLLGMGGLLGALWDDDYRR